MTSTELIPTRQASPSRGARSILRSTFGGRCRLIAAGAGIVVAGLAFNWSWLVAAGVAPVLLSVLPCVAMCVLGLCMNRMTGRSCATENASSGETADGPKALSADMRGGG
ncbi:hypothetical protein [Mesorhizobium sp. GbtcB19]|uniref:hypothetical protein n=1 Tax=Mesorhizobium sp. GbtcB19 TaxID=2824764 RepID=UPI001C2F1C6F|nr:hypothetical protein [Mesorhizobium sp. GbtcB19]